MNEQSYIYLFLLHTSSSRVTNILHPSPHQGFACIPEPGLSFTKFNTKSRQNDKLYSIKALLIWLNMKAISRNVSQRMSEVATTIVSQNSSFSWADDAIEKYEEIKKIRSSDNSTVAGTSSNCKGNNSRRARGPSYSSKHHSHRQLSEDVDMDRVSNSNSTNFAVKHDLLVLSLMENITDELEPKYPEQVEVTTVQIKPTISEDEDLSRDAIIHRYWNGPDSECHEGKRYTDEYLQLAHDEFLLGYGLPYRALFLPDHTRTYYDEASPTYKTPCPKVLDSSKYVP